MGEWTKERYESFRKELFAQAEPEFARFQAKLLRSDLPVIGLRTPFLRKTAKELVKDDGEAFLRFCGRDTYEERLLYGLVAAALPVPYEVFWDTAMFMWRMWWKTGRIVMCSAPP